MPLLMFLLLGLTSGMPFQGAKYLEKKSSLSSGLALCTVGVERRTRIIPFWYLSVSMTPSTLPEVSRAVSLSVLGRIASSWALYTSSPWAGTCPYLASPSSSLTSSLLAPLLSRTSLTGRPQATSVTRACRPLRSTGVAGCRGSDSTTLHGDSQSREQGVRGSK